MKINCIICKEIKKRIMEEPSSLEAILDIQICLDCWVASGSPYSNPYHAIYKILSDDQLFKLLFFNFVSIVDKPELAQSVRFFAKQELERRKNGT